MIEVIEVKTRKDLETFIRVPFFLYAKDEFYVPPLIKEMRKHFSDENPFFRHAKVRYFLAKKNGRIRGRIVSSVNQHHIEFHKEKAGFFGFFEASNDYEIASALLDTASEALRKEGMDIMRGPMNFSTNDECGFLIEGFESPPMLMMPYNPIYYNDLMERCGMEKAKDLYAYIFDMPEEPPKKILRVAGIAEKNGISARQFDQKNFDSDMKVFQEVYNSAWEKNWGFIPLDNEERAYMGKNLKPVIVPELTWIAEKDGTPVGFLGLLPDFNFVLKHMNGKINPLSLIKALYYSRKIKDLRLLLLGIKPEYRNKGVDALLFREGFYKIKKGGYKRVEFSWILEDNIPIQRIVDMIGGRLYKKYRIYEKSL
jgi:hypothetical protein